MTSVIFVRCLDKILHVCGLYWVHVGQSHAVTHYTDRFKCLLKTKSSTWVRKHHLIGIVHWAIGTPTCYVVVKSMIVSFQFWTRDFKIQRYQMSWPIGKVKWLKIFHMKLIQLIWKVTHVSSICYCCDQYKNLTLFERFKF